MGLISRVPYIGGSSGSSSGGSGGGGSGSDDDSQSGSVTIANGVSYVDVTFNTAFEDAEWTGGGVSISNTVDSDALNLFPGVITSKTTDGFRQQLNGLTDSENYLFWYRCTGASSGSGTTTVATPTFSPVAGTYDSEQEVTISTATSGATIHYTLDGSTPTSGSTAYSTPIAISAPQTIKAIGVKSGATDSAVASAAYEITTSKLRVSAGNAITAAVSLAAPTGGTFTAASNTGGHLAASTAYYYRATAYNGNGETTPSTSQIYTTPSGTATNQITFNWNAVTGAVGYNIYRGTTSGTELYLGSSLTTSFADIAAFTPVDLLPTINTTGYGIGQQTLALFHFDEGTGTTSADDSGYGLTATLNGGVTWGAEATRIDYHATNTFDSGASLVFNGTSGYVTIPTLLDACPASFTIACTVKVPGGGLDGTARHLFSKVWSATKSLEVFTFGGKLYFRTKNGAFSLYSAVLTWTAGASYGIALVVSPGRALLYRSDPATSSVNLLVDSWTDATTFGIEAFTAAPDAISYFSGASPTAFVIGANNLTGTPAGFTSLTVDEFIIEDHPWTADEMEARMAQWLPFVATSERALAVRSNYPTLIETQTWELGACGETNLVWESAADRLHATYTASAGVPSIGYAYSDDYGQTWVKPLSDKIAGNGVAGVSGGGLATHSGFLWASDGYVYLSFSQNIQTIYMVKSTLTTAGGAHTLTEVMTGGFAGGTSFPVLAHTAFSQVGPNTGINALCNTSLIEAGGVFYMTVDALYANGVFQTCFASCATPRGTYTALASGCPASLQPPGTTNTNNGAASLKYDAANAKFHLWLQYQNQPCDVWHWVSTDCLTWSKSTTADNQPVLPITHWATNQGPHSGWCDQYGDPEGWIEVTLSGGAKRCIGQVNFVNNHVNPASGRVYTYTYEGSLDSLT